MRVIKYQSKGYSIQKREWLKLLVACMFKKVDSWDELKNQIGGSYGDVVSLDTSKPFDLESVIESLTTAHYEAKADAPVPVNDDEAVAATVEKQKPEAMPGTAPEAIAKIFVAEASK